MMRLNDAGAMILDVWHKIPEHFPNIDIDEFVVMPNHFHGIIVVGAQFIVPFNCDAINQKKKQGVTNQGVMNHAPTVGEIVRAFKARGTHAINQTRNSPGHPVWQRNYYEHIIRSEEEMNRVREYIMGNPLKWAEDKDNPANIIRGGGFINGKGLMNQTPAYI
jgi:REP element-mobilizing transposase RayT